MERDDIIEYSLDVSHSAEEGKGIRKRLWMVFWLLLVVTIIEVAMGMVLPKADYKMLLMVSFIFFTVVKAGGIVLIFMHLGDEMKFLRYIILIPYICFIAYLLFICISEATYMWEFLRLFG